MTTPKTKADDPKFTAADGPEPLNIPGPMEAPLAVRGGEDMRVSGEPGPQSAPTGPTGPPDLGDEDPGINAHVVS